MSKKWLKYFFIAVTLTVLIVTVGCASSEPGQAPSSGDGDQEELVFGMVVKYPGAPFIQAFINGAEQKAEELGVKIDIKDGQADSMTIMNLMDNYITQGVDGFIMAGAVDLRAIVPGVQRLNEAGIPIMALDTSPEGGRVEMFISFDIEQSTVQATEIFVDGIKERNGGQVPEGVVIEITGSVEDMFAQACTRGFKSVIEQYPQLTIASAEGHWNNVDSNERTSDLLTRHGADVVGIYVHTPDIMGPGAVSAIEAAGLDPVDYGITGICMGPEGVELIKEGKILAIVAQPAMTSAELAVQYLYNLNKGLPIPQIGDVVEEEGALWSPAEVIENPWADEGAFMVLQGPLVPFEVEPDDPRLWENRLRHLW